MCKPGLYSAVVLDVHPSLQFSTCGDRVVGGWVGGAWVTRCCCCCCWGLKNDSDEFFTAKLNWINNTFEC